MGLLRALGLKGPPPQRVSGQPLDALSGGGGTTLFGREISNVKTEPSTQAARPGDVPLGYVLEVCLAWQS